MECRIGCGACCIAPSISSPLPGMPHGKPARVRCVNLNIGNQCKIWGQPNFPEVCRKFVPSLWVCGTSQAEALSFLSELEALTTPSIS